MPIAGSINYIKETSKQGIFIIIPPLLLCLTLQKPSHICYLRSSCIVFVTSITRLIEAACEVRHELRTASHAQHSVRNETLVEKHPLRNNRSSQRNCVQQLLGLDQITVSPFFIIIIILMACSKPRNRPSAQALK